MYTITRAIANDYIQVEVTDWCRLSDEECVTLLHQGNNDAFSELIRRYQQRIYRYILRMISNSDDALDLTQDTFVSAFQHIASWQPKALFRTWLFRIATNKTMDHLRRNKLWNYEIFDEDNHMIDNGLNIEQQLDSLTLCAEMVNLIEELPPIFRQALLLRELEEMSYIEIAQALDVNEGTVKSRIARARDRLITGLARITNYRG